MPAAAVDNLVHETSTTTGTGNLTTSAVNGKQRGDAVFGTSDNGAANPWVFISSRDGAEWEVRQTYWSATGTVVRSGSPYKSSNANATVNFSAGTKDVCVDVPAHLQKISGLRSEFFRAEEFTPRITNGPSVSVRERATNDHTLTMLSFDPSTEEFATLEWRPPKTWNKGTIQLVFGWEHQPTATNFGVAWKASAVAVSDDDATDSATGTAQTATDTGGTTEDRYISPATAAITVGGSPAEGDSLIITISRDPANGSDNMAIDADLVWVRLLWTENAPNED
jgi:hypothetical protein